METEGIINTEEKESLSVSKIRWFLQSPLADRMRQAAAQGHLHRESQFMAMMPAYNLYPNTTVADPVITQGVMDAWFEEGDSIVLLDYKTDYVPDEGGEDVLRQKYAVQLTCYRKALEQMTGKPVKETLIYSFSLGRTLAL